MRVQITLSNEYYARLCSMLALASAMCEQHAKDSIDGAISAQYAQDCITAKLLLKAVYENYEYVE